MHITLYAMNDAPEFVNKTLNRIHDTEGDVANMPLDILNPTIDLDLSALISLHVDEPISTYGINYVYIREFKRYYFINKYEILATGIYRMYMHVDVLMSYRNDILNNIGIIRRQQNIYDLYLNDGSLKVENYPMLQTLTFSNGNIFDSWKYIVTVAGGS